MHPEAKTAMEAQAIDWLIRQRDPDFADWEGFTDWLAEDSGHAAAYDAVASLDADLDALPPAAVAPAVVACPAHRPMPRPTRRWWLGGAVAAALVGAIALSGPDLFGDAERIATAAGEQRMVELADGSRIEINGASIVTLDDDRPRFARLESGEAMFHIVHRDDAPFVVETGGAKIVDLGTAFNIVRRAGQTSVAVSEGAVLYNPDGDNVRVAAGQGIVAKDGDDRPPRIEAIDVANVGSWRTGLLVYNGSPLALVAEDLKRTAGIDVTLAPSAAALTFRGALIVAEDRDRTVADLAALSGTRAERRGGGWVLTR